MILWHDYLHKWYSAVVVRVDISVPGHKENYNHPLNGNQTK